MYVYIYIYIYVCIEREREIIHKTYISSAARAGTHGAEEPIELSGAVNIMYVYTYIYIYIHI